MGRENRNTVEIRHEDVILIRHPDDLKHCAFSEEPGTQTETETEQRSGNEWPEPMDNNDCQMIFGDTPNQIQDKPAGDAIPEQAELGSSSPRRSSRVRQPNSRYTDYVLT